MAKVKEVDAFIEEIEREAGDASGTETVSGVVSRKTFDSLEALRVLKGGRTVSRSKLVALAVNQFVARAEQLGVLEQVKA
jgi:hypothetical protein